MLSKILKRLLNRKIFSKREHKKESFVQHEVKMPSRLGVHEKTVDAVECEEDGNVQGQDSIDDDVKETEEEIEKKAVAVKMIDEDNAGIDDGDNCREYRGGHCQVWRQ